MQTSSDISEIAAPATAGKTLHLSWPHLLLGAAGMALSVYSWHIHRVIKAGGESGCGLSESLNCDKVLSSPYGEFFGIPLGVYGMMFFAIVLLTAVSTEANISWCQFRLTQLAIATAGILTSLGLLYISKVILQAYCPICLGIHTTTTLLFLTSLFQWRKAVRRETSDAPLETPGS